MSELEKIRKKSKTEFFWFSDLFSQVFMKRLLRLNCKETTRNNKKDATIFSKRNCIHFHEKRFSAPKNVGIYNINEKE